MGQKQSSSIMKEASKDKEDDLVPILADSEVGRKKYDEKGGIKYGQSRFYVNHGDEEFNSLSDMKKKGEK